MKQTNSSELRIPSTKSCRQATNSLSRSIAFLSILEASRIYQDINSEKPVQGLCARVSRVGDVTIRQGADVIVGWKILPY